MVWCGALEDAGLASLSECLLKAPSGREVKVEVLDAAPPLVVFPKELVKISCGPLAALAAPYRWSALRTPGVVDSVVGFSTRDGRGSSVSLSLSLSEATTAQLVAAHSAASSSDSRMVASVGAFLARSCRSGAAPMEERVPFPPLSTALPPARLLLAVLPTQHSVTRTLP